MTTKRSLPVGAASDAENNPASPSISSTSPGSIAIGVVADAAGFCGCDPPRASARMGDPPQPKVREATTTKLEPSEVRMRWFLTTSISRSNCVSRPGAQPVARRLPRSAAMML